MHAVDNATKIACSKAGVENYSTLVFTVWQLFLYVKDYCSKGTWKANEQLRLAGCHAATLPAICKITAQFTFPISSGQLLHPLFYTK